MKDAPEFDVFLSYSSRDVDLVRQVAERLRADGVRVWWDRWEIKPGDNFVLAIEQGLARSQKVVLFLSPTAFDSDWVGLERTAVLAWRGVRGRLIPILIAETEIPPILAPIHRLDFRGDWNLAYPQLLAACRSAMALPAEVRPTVSEAKAGRALRATAFPRLACPDFLRPYRGG